MQLVWTDDKMHQKDCPVAVSIDYKDSFLSQGNGWNTLNFPNEAERKAFDYDPAQLHGVVVLVFTSCDWDNCEDSYLGPKDFDEQSKQWEMKINGIAVNSLHPIGHKAFLVKGVNGIYFSPSSENDYKIEIKVNELSKHVKISSFIIY